MKIIKLKLPKFWDITSYAQKGIGIDKVGKQNFLQRRQTCVDNGFLDRRGVEDVGTTYHFPDAMHEGVGKMFHFNNNFHLL